MRGVGRRGHEEVRRSGSVYGTAGEQREREVEQ
jgi:hypothetical protein